MQDQDKSKDSKWETIAVGNNKWEGCSQDRRDFSNNSKIVTMKRNLLPSISTKIASRVKGHRLEWFKTLMIQVSIKIKIMMRLFHLMRLLKIAIIKWETKAWRSMATNNNRIIDSNLKKQLLKRFSQLLLLSNQGTRMLKSLKWEDQSLEAIMRKMRFHF